jgi:hypothetical protein
MGSDAPRKPLISLRRRLPPKNAAVIPNRRSVAEDGEDPLPTERYSWSAGDSSPCFAGSE